MVLNPYDLLGATPNSTCQEVRKRYYSLACLCHPDRGGTNDQMQILHNAYQYVSQQVAFNNNDRTYEDLEADFVNFCAEQKSTPPSFSDIHADAFNLPRFNELFKHHTEDDNVVVDGAFAEGGYEIVPSDASMEYLPVESNEIHPFVTTLAVYEEPMPAVMPQTMVRDLTCAQLDDFSCRVGCLLPSDYRAALSPPQPVASFAEGDVMSEFEKRVNSRLL